MAFIPKFLMEMTQETRAGAGEGGAMWEMAAASVHHDVLLYSQERHERVSHCASADDSLVEPCERQRLRVGSTNFVLSGMPRMDGMEELSALCGRPCWRWKDSMTTQEKNIKER